MRDWFVWGDASTPEYVGSERECKDYVEAKAKADAAALYVQDPECGNAYEYDGITWTEI